MPHLLQVVTEVLQKINGLVPSQGLSRQSSVEVLPSPNSSEGAVSQAPSSGSSPVESNGAQENG